MRSRLGRSRGRSGSVRRPGRPRASDPLTDDAPKNMMVGQIDHRVFSVRSRRLSQRARRSKPAPTLSLLALNARQRLSAIKQQSENGRSADRDQTEGETLDNVNTITSPITGMLASQHPHAQSAMPTQELDTIRPSDD